MDNGLKNADDLRRGIFSHMGNVGLVLTGTYTELGIVSGNSVLVWADTHSTITGSKGIRDRSRNTDGSDGCSKQQGANGPVDNVGLP